MNKRIYISLLSFILFISRPYSAFAQTTIRLQKPAQIAGGNITADSTVNFIIGLLSAIGVVAALIYLLYGGIKWIMSGGDKANVEAARSHIVAAIIGLVIIILTYAILSIVFSLLGLGSLPTRLEIPQLF